MAELPSAAHVAAVELIVGVAGAVNCGSLLKLALAVDVHVALVAVTV